MPRAISLNVDPPHANSLQRSLAGVNMLTALLAVVFALSGCGQTISATISVYHTLPDSTSLTRYAFVLLNDQSESNENAVYKKAIQEELVRYHYVESDEVNASLLLSFSYGMNEGREVESPGIVTTSSYTEYRRGLWMFLFQKGAAGEDEKKVVYEGSVMCAGRLEQVSTVMPEMIRALFREFPGESGKTRKEFIDL
jgi:hypothetical protein